MYTSGASNHDNANPAVKNKHASIRLSNAKKLIAGGTKTIQTGTTGNIAHIPASKTLVKLRMEKNV